MRFFYPKFALDAIRKNQRSYIPYLLTTAFVVAMYFILRTLSLSEVLEQSYGGTELTVLLGLGSNVIAIFSVIFLFYTSSFLMKQRKQEFGLYSVLGMEKRHIARILLFETLIVAAIGIAAGLLVGALLNWLSFLLLVNMLGGDTELPFRLSVLATSDTVALFLGIFFLILLNNLRQVQFCTAISLLSGSSEGEREPRSNWPLAVLGVLFLGAGYAMALYIKNPVGAFALFFVAVVLVILGTYCLFTSGSIVFLKFLRKNKRYYYQTRHFISVSGLLYRMKQNAISLGNICILSTMVLVTVSSTMSLYSGCDAMVESRYPRELNITLRSSDVTPKTNQRAIALLDEMLAEQGVVPENRAQISFLSFGTMQDGSSFTTNIDDRTLMGELTSLAVITAVPLSDYNSTVKAPVDLQNGHALLYCSESYGYDSLSVLGQTYQVSILSDFLYADILTDATVANLILVVPDAEVAFLNQLQTEQYGKNASDVCTYIGMDIPSDASEKISNDFSDRCMTLFDSVTDEESFEYWFAETDTREYHRDSFLQLYAGLFFVGIFLGLLFLVATILIIYYKQLTEGLQDRRRYTIMRQVGLTDREIRASIHSQVLTVFFLPLVTAFIHTAFAFPMVKRCLQVLSMTNVSAFILCTILCCSVFAAFYLLVYMLTSKVYYRIVNQDGR